MMIRVFDVSFGVDTVEELLDSADHVVVVSVLPHWPRQPGGLCSSASTRPNGGPGNFAVLLTVVCDSDSQAHGVVSDIVAAAGAGPLLVERREDVEDHAPALAAEMWAMARGVS